MADMIVEFRIMPEGGEVEYTDLESEVKNVLENYHDSLQIRALQAEPVGFGLQAVRAEIQIDENCGSEDLENKLAEIEIVGEVSITKMDRL